MWRDPLLHKQHSAESNPGSSCFKWSLWDLCSQTMLLPPFTQHTHFSCNLLIFNTLFDKKIHCLTRKPCEKARPTTRPFLLYKMTIHENLFYLKYSQILCIMKLITFNIYCNTTECAIVYWPVTVYNKRV